MIRSVASSVVLVALAGAAAAQPSGSGPSGAGLAQAAARARVTDDTLKNPAPGDWLMYSRTYDAQRFSPLEQINRSNVSKLAKAWSKPLPAGSTEVIPIVHAGVMYLTTPGSRTVGSKVWALDATTGDLLWEYAPANTLSTRVKALAIYGDEILYTAPAPMGEPSPVIALDAATGAVRWSTPVAPETHTSGAIVVEGKVITGRTCNSERKNCYIAAHDAVTGKEVWRFYTTPGAGEPGDQSWAGTPVDERRAAVWGLPGTYDPVRKLLFWGISNPMPNTRAERHGGNADAIPTTAPADLYSNSTVALKPDTGELVWYYQHLPGDDWDMDINHEKTLIRTVVNPNPRFVKWINPDVPKGVERDVVITVGEGGGVWVNDRATGQFLWAMPFPYDTPNFIVADIDVKTGIAKINRDLVLDKPGKQAVVCYWNTRSFWPTAYSPRTSSLYVPYVDHCLDMQRPDANGEGGHRGGVIRPGGDPARFAGLAKIDMRTGEIKRLFEGSAAGTGAVLATAGGVVFWGDTAQVLRAFDEDTGKVLWQSESLGASVSTSTITYAVGGRQYVAVVNGEPLLGTGALSRSAGITLPQGRGPSVNVFALPR